VGIPRTPSLALEKGACKGFLGQLLGRKGSGLGDPPARDVEVHQVGPAETDARDMAAMEPDDPVRRSIQREPPGCPAIPHCDPQEAFRVHNGDQVEFGQACYGSLPVLDLTAFPRSS